MSLQQLLLQDLSYLEQIVEHIVLFFQPNSVLNLLSQYLTSGVIPQNQHPFEEIHKGNHKKAKEQYHRCRDMPQGDEDKLQKCLGLEGDTYGVTLNLKYNDKNSEVFANKRMTDRIAFCPSKGSFHCSNEDIYVTIYENGQLKTGLLNIKIQEVEKNLPLP